MTDKFVPTIEEVRSHYMIPSLFIGVKDAEALAEFQRWLAKRDAEVAAKAYAQGVGRTLEVMGTATSPGDGLLTLIGNPYQKAVQS